MQTKKVIQYLSYEFNILLYVNRDGTIKNDIAFLGIRTKPSLGKYKENGKEMRIIADHIRGSVFLISEGIFPSNIERGYILRRLLRRAIRYGKLLGMEQGFLIPLAQKVIEIYKDIYPELLSKETDILTVIQKEEEKFEKTLERGLSQLEKH